VTDLLYHLENISKQKNIIKAGKVSLIKIKLVF
jgi:hypothetical protein